MNPVTRPVTDDPSGRSRLGDVLLELGVIDHRALASALEAQLADGGTRRLGRVVRDLGLVGEADLARALATQHGLPLIDLDLAVVDTDVARLIPRSLAERNVVVAWAWHGTRLAIAVADPVDVVTLDDVRTRTGITGLDVHVTTESRIREALRLAWSEGDDRELVRNFLDELSPASPVEEIDPSTDAATIRLVDRLLNQAVREGASDVHVEPQRDGVRVRMRVDGVLRDAMTLPRTGSGAITARLKIIADLDVIERRLPQDGRALIRVEGERVDLRLSTLPSLHGEKVVIRLLPASDRLPSLENLGFTSVQRSLLVNVVSRPQGLVLITGPTGSGKTNTLYATIAAGTDSERNVMTLEDPVEIELPGITQVPIDDRVGMGFARGLRAAMRQDPDVILVGEVRDQETAELAVRAALTGHLVLSTLHTLDCASAVTRLVDMGVPPYLVTSSLALVVSQRLVRTPCVACCVPDRPEPAVLSSLGVGDDSGAWVRAIGCPECHDTGYSGRSAVVETLEIGPEVRRALIDGAGEESVRRAARDAGTASLLDHALDVARQGRTTIAEVLRAVPRDHEI